MQVDGSGLGSPVYSAEKFRSVLTPKRLALWRAIRDLHPPLVMKLSQICLRDPKSVHRDLKILASLGIVGLEPGIAGYGKSVRPVCLMDSLFLVVR